MGFLPSSFTRVLSKFLEKYWGKVSQVERAFGLPLVLTSPDTCILPGGAPLLAQAPAASSLTRSLLLWLSAVSGLFSGTWATLGPLVLCGATGNILAYWDILSWILPSFGSLLPPLSIPRPARQSKKSNPLSASQEESTTRNQTHWHLDHRFPGL